MYPHHVCAWCLKRLEEGVGSARTGVMVVNLRVCAGNQTRTLCKNSALKLGSSLQSLQTKSPLGLLFICLGIFWVLVLETGVLLSSPDWYLLRQLAWLQTHDNPPDSSLQVLGLKVCGHMDSVPFYFKNICTNSLVISDRVF